MEKRTVPSLTSSSFLALHSFDTSPPRPREALGDPAIHVRDTDMAQSGGVSIPRSSDESAVEKHDPNLVYRVLGIPRNYNRACLRSKLAESTGLGVDDITIYSFSSNPSASHPDERAATISFDRPSRHVLRKDPPRWTIQVMAIGTGSVEYDELFLDTEFTGFTPLSPVEKDCEHTIDCIVIHGWGGHAFGSFKERGTTYSWLNTLAKDFPSLRLWLYGYRSNLQDDTSIGDVNTWADTFTVLLGELRLQTGCERPIIYVVHSLGGLIFKEAMIRMKSSSNFQDKTNFRSVYGALFFGVPAQGMDVQDIAAMIQNRQQRCTSNLLDQRVGHMSRKKQHEEFCKAFDFPDSRIIQFFETRKTPTVRWDEDTKRWKQDGDSKLLVNPDSATYGRHWETEAGVYVIPLDGDHSGMVKLGPRDTDGYPKIRRVMREFVQLAIPVVKVRLSDAPPIPPLTNWKPPDVSLAKRKAESSVDEEPEAKMIKVDRAPKPPNAEDQQDCLRSLFYREMNLRRYDIRRPCADTCQWLPQNQNFHTWNRGRRGFLWIRGKPGSGKSTLMAHIMREDSHTSADGGLVTASFFFHGRGTDIQKSEIGLLRSILHQLLSSIPDLLYELAIVYKEKDGTEKRGFEWHPAELRDFFEDHVAIASTAQPIRLYIDALDEAGERTAQDILAFFRRILSRPACRLSICFSCRYYPNLGIGTGDEIRVDEENSKDISTFIESELSQIISNKEERRSIYNEIYSRSSSTFQWVDIVIRRIIDSRRRGESMASIRRDLQNSPLELNDLYRNLLDRIKTHDRLRSLKLLQWICFARIPLTTAELRRAMAMDDNNCADKSLQVSESSEEFAATEEDFHRQITYLSAGLVEIVRVPEARSWVWQDESQTLPRAIPLGAQFVHHSVLEYLLSEGLNQLDDGLSSTFGEVHSRLAKCCVKYIAIEEVLSDAIFQHPQLSSERMRRCIHVSEPVSVQLGHHTSAQGATISDDSYYHEACYHCCSNRGHARRLYMDKVTEIHPLIGYAISSLMYHSTLAEKEDVDQTYLLEYFGGSCWKPFQCFLLMERVFGVQSNHRAQDGDFFRNGLQFLHVAAYYGLSSIFKTALPSAHMLHKDARYADWHAFDRLGRPPLWYAAHRGHLGVVRQFLQVMEDRCLDHADKNKRTPVLAAAISGHDEVVELLASHDGIRINQRDVTGEAIAISSAKQGNLKILRTIMQRQDVNLNLQDRFGRTPLHHAVFSAHYNVVRALLDRRDVNRNSCDQNGAAPLHTAVSVGNFDIVELLLSLPGSGASSSGSHEQLARYQGASYAETLRHESASDSGTEYSANIVDINLQDRAGKTALMRATYPDLARIARVLLEHRADVHLKDIHGRTSLIRAVQEGSFTIVQLLLTHGANVADRDLDCNTALGYALEISNRYDCGSIKWKRYAQIVKLLESFNATESEITKPRASGVAVVVSIHITFTRHHSDTGKERVAK